MNEIRNWFILISHNVKISSYTKLLGIDNGSFTKFIKGQDNAVKKDRLEDLRRLIINDLSSKIA